MAEKLLSANGTEEKAMISLDCPWCEGCTTILLSYQKFNLALAEYSIATAGCGGVLGRVALVAVLGCVTCEI